MKQYITIPPPTPPKRRELPRYVYETGNIATPYKVTVRRNKKLAFLGGFKTVEDASKAAAKIKAGRNFA